MITTFKRSSFLMLSLLCITLAHASPALKEPTNPVDYPRLAEQCRQLALKLDSLSQNQNREACRMNLDGLNVYFASNYIATNWINKAIEVLTSAIYQVRYAFDIGCYDQTSILDVINELTKIRNILNESRQ